MHSIVLFLVQIFTINAIALWFDQLVVTKVKSHIFNYNLRQICKLQNMLGADSSDNSAASNLESDDG